MKSRIAAPGLHSYKRGMIKVKEIRLVINHEDCKVWELNVKSGRPDIHCYRTSSEDFNGWSVELNDHDVIMETDRKRMDNTVLKLGLNPNQKWVVSARSIGRGECVIYAYRY